MNRQRLPVQLIAVMLLVLVLIACAPRLATPTVGSPPTATPVASTTPLPLTATATPAPTLSPTTVPGGSVHPLDTRTGIAGVDAVIEAMLALEPERVITEARANQNACCAGAAATAIETAKQLGADQADQIAYATSYDKSPGNSFVGSVGLVM